MQIELRMLHEQSGNAQREVRSAREQARAIPDLQDEVRALRERQGPREGTTTQPALATSSDGWGERLREVVVALREDMLAEIDSSREEVERRIKQWARSEFIEHGLTKAEVAGMIDRGCGTESAHLQ